MPERGFPLGGIRSMPRAGLAAILAFLLSACAADQSPALPPDPDAPFPLRNARTVSQPAPGALIVIVRDTLAEFSQVRLAAREWCGGPAQASPVSENRISRFQRDTTWVIRCQ